MRIAVAALLAAPVLVACTSAGGDRIARDAAKSVIGRTVATRFPGVPVGPAVDCLIENATRDEVLGLASDTMTGPTAATTETIFLVARRPATIQCLAARGSAAFPT
jgi:hypothetical protein